MQPDDETRYRDTIEQMCTAARLTCLQKIERRTRFTRKADTSPVTELDREIELTLREIVRTRHPDDAIRGEEYGLSNHSDGDKSKRICWVIDPLDGTRAFITGSPLWGTLVGVLNHGKPWLGAIELPMLRKRMLSWTARAAPAPFGPSSLAHASMATTTPDKLSEPHRRAFHRLRDAVGTHRYGGDCFNYAALASGNCDLVVEAGLAPHDFLPIVPIIEAVGGSITDWQGRALGESSPGDVLAAANPALHAAALGLLSTES
ncbi:inositol monophosphatase family protein [Burkholderia sp. 22PA0106]|uniref:inositol monophosphatase family protein n=1 Tax=Burkholderia sp. 22PA0106 TaxID=3237371 RepID=UPI0039C08599